ncbi:MAG: efflux RND transporter permease subunit, partial [Bacteroidota bacterium]
MIKFLIHRPIAVIMTFTAVIVLGIIASGLLPVSLMPGISIPEITVRVDRPGESARQINNEIVDPLRYHLMQVPYLDDLDCKSRNGRATLQLRFDHGADMNYSFIDVNEKIDAAMRDLPDDMERPSISRATASDLPVFYVNVWHDQQGKNRFMNMSKLAQAVMVKRMEQLPEVAMVDMTGHDDPELLIKPDKERLKSLGMTDHDITRALEENNISMGSLQVVDGQYIFNIRFSNSLNTINDVKNVRLKAGPRLLKLEDLARIEQRPRQKEGMFLSNGSPALSMAVVKRSDARMEDLKESVEELINTFRKDYPGMNFDIVRDQTTLLDQSIKNLGNNLLLGGSLAFLVLFFFLKEPRSPWIIGISIPTSLIMAILFFHMAGLSINIISLSGLILGVGMMIDNAIIVIDNITQQATRGHSLAQSCIKGTNEVIRPLISSVLTTCAVFLPLVFLSGISGALFYDQALAVAVGLLASLVVSITLIPVLYHLFRVKSPENKEKENKKTKGWLRHIPKPELEKLYDKGFHWMFAHRKMTYAFFLLLIVPAVWMFLELPRKRFPAFTQSETMMHIDWNEKIGPDGNNQRTTALRNIVDSLTITDNAYVGTQKFKLQKDIDQTIRESLLYFSCQSPTDVDRLKKSIEKHLETEYPGAIFSFHPPETIFDKLFSNDQPLLMARISNNQERGIPSMEEAIHIKKGLEKKYPGTGFSIPSTGSYIEVKANPDRMALYGVSQSRLIEKLRTGLDARQVGVLHTGSEYMPMVIGGSQQTLDQLLKELKVPNKNTTPVPVKELISIGENNDYKTLHSGSRGTYLPLSIANIPGNNANQFMRDVSGWVKEDFKGDMW